MTEITIEVIEAAAGMSVEKIIQRYPPITANEYVPMPVPQKHVEKTMAGWMLISDVISNFGLTHNQIIRAMRSNKLTQVLFFGVNLIPKNQASMMAKNIKSNSHRWSPPPAPPAPNEAESRLFTVSDAAQIINIVRPAIHGDTRGLYTMTIDGINTVLYRQPDDEPKLLAYALTGNINLLHIDQIIHFCRRQHAKGVPNAV